MQQQQSSNGDLLLEQDWNEQITITPKSERRSSRYMTKFEMARVIGERAKQIAGGSIDLTNQPVSSALLRKGAKKSSKLAAKRKKDETAVDESPSQMASYPSMNSNPDPRSHFQLGATPVLSAIDVQQRQQGGVNISTSFDMDLMDDLDLGTAVTSGDSSDQKNGDALAAKKASVGENDKKSTTLAIVQQAQNATNPYDKSIDPVMIAKYELVQRQIPFVVRRTWPSGYKEHIPVKDLEIDLLWLDLYLN